MGHFRERCAGYLLTPFSGTRVLSLFIKTALLVLFLFRQSLLSSRLSTAGVDFIPVGLPVFSLICKDFFFMALVIGFFFFSDSLMIRKSTCPPLRVNCVSVGVHPRTLDFSNLVLVGLAIFPFFIA